MKTKCPRKPISVKAELLKALRDLLRVVDQEPGRTVHWHKAERDQALAAIVRALEK